MVPAGCSSVSCEITAAPGSDLDGWNDEQLLDRTLADLARDEIIDAKNVVYRTVHREKFAYVLYDLGYSERVGIVRDFVETRKIHLAGRFAEYRYVNTDACVRRALDLARQLRGGDIAQEARIPEAFVAEVARG
jgi:protoporphyrinogen oxidase